MTDMVANIAEDLLPLAYPIEKLRSLPGNPNKGDVDAVTALYKAVGQRKPIVARKDKDGHETVIAGNTQRKAALKLGWTHIAVSWANDLDEQQTVAYALGDNETARKGETDEEAALRMMKQLEDYPSLLDASGYDLAYIQELEEGVELPDEPELSLEDPDLDLDDEVEVTEVRSIGTPIIQHTIVFDDKEQQQQWFKFIRWLKDAWPDKDETIGSRLSKYLQAEFPIEED